MLLLNAPEAKYQSDSPQFIKTPELWRSNDGCRIGLWKFTVEMLCDKADITPDNVIILQDKNGFDDMVDSLMEMADKKLAILNQRRRETLPLADFIDWASCGGSDAFSVFQRIHSRICFWYAKEGGATVLFSEVTEVRDGVYLLAERCINTAVGKN